MTTYQILCLLGIPAMILGMFKYLHSMIKKNASDNALRNSRLSAQTDTLGQHFTLGDLQIDYDQRTVTLSGTDISLTQTEYNILVYLSEHAGKALTYSAIIKAVWGYQDSGSIKRLQVNMANIRKKLGIKPGDNRYIINELGVGYRMLTEG